MAGPWGIAALAGEKSAAIHLPLFAAANALYSNAKDRCPRLLDEAFVGIDDAISRTSLAWRSNSTWTCS